jgi:hypothetical protein
MTTSRFGLPAKFFSSKTAKICRIGPYTTRFLATGREKKSIQLDDWDGDGLCDILSVDRATGAVNMWKNTWKAGQKSPTFAAVQRVIDTGNHCTEGWDLAFTTWPSFCRHVSKVSFLHLLLS